MSKETTNTPISDQTVSNIDAAIAAAKNRKAAKVAAGTTTATTKTATPKEPKEAKPKMSDEDKAAKLAAREAERAAKKAERDAARTAKIAERNANRAPAHMKKVAKAAEKLTALGQAAELLFNEATANLPGAELAALATHIQHFNRVKATERALDQSLEVGQEVTIVGGDPRFIGKTGTLAKVQRIRCYVTVEGINKPVYLFTSDVSLSAAAPAIESATA
jgi:multidrug efflux pump subunit AcrA (membrane-fusion protein)